MGADLSNKPFDLSGGLIKLSKNRFLTSTSDEMFLIDDELNIIASVATPHYSIYKNSQLIVCRVSDKYMAIDFDGKIVLEPKYSSLTLYGGYALTDITEFDGTVKTNYLVSKDNIAGTALENMIAENESLLLNSYGIIVKLDQNNKATVYNYAGTEIMSIDDGFCCERPSRQKRQIVSYRNRRQANTLLQLTYCRNLTYFNSFRAPSKIGALFLSVFELPLLFGKIGYSFLPRFNQTAHIFSLIPLYF